jgi:hypothetical protein
MLGRSLIPETSSIARVDIATEKEHHPGEIVATEDPALIRLWAARHQAEPATGEASSSGPATISVTDGDAGIRFNFPAAGRFRPIAWEEWFRNFHEHELLFVYEADAPAALSTRYRLVKRDSLKPS